MAENQVFDSAQETKPLPVGSRVPDVKFMTIEGKEFDFGKEISKKPSVTDLLQGRMVPLLQHAARANAAD